MQCLNQFDLAIRSSHALLVVLDDTAQQPKSTAETRLLASKVTGMQAKPLRPPALWSAAPALLQGFSIGPFPVGNVRHELTPPA